MDPSRILTAIPLVLMVQLAAPADAAQQLVVAATSATRIPRCKRTTADVPVDLRLADAPTWSMTLDTATLDGSYVASGRRGRDFELTPGSAALTTLAGWAASRASAACGAPTAVSDTAVASFRLRRGRGTATTLKLAVRFVVTGTGRRGRVRVAGRGRLETLPVTTPTTTTSPTASTTSTTAPECTATNNGTGCTDDGIPCTRDVCAAGVCTHPVASQGTVCRPAEALCDVEETCDGVATTCPTDAFAPDTTVCRVEAGACDVADHCSGTSAACPDAVRPAATVCRASEGPCDPAEACSGTSPDCPTDVLHGPSVVCNQADQPCEADAVCSGSSPNCPANGFLAAGTLCRTKSSACDADDFCTGSSASCADKLLQGVVCRDVAGPCDVAEYCNGGARDCPPDEFEPAQTVCRPKANDCDVTDACSGTSAACPDAFSPSNTLCRAADGECDLAEYCTGSSGACPADSWDTSGTLCRSPSQPCQLAATCNGSGPGCPQNPLKPAGTPCRAQSGLCDVADTCNGSSPACPDAVAPGGTTCRAAAGGCDFAETCDGVTKNCGFDFVRSYCQALQGPCDIVDSCLSGNANYPNCPADQKVAAQTPCDSGTALPACQYAICNGVSNACNTTANRPASYVCRPAANDCDVPETCGTLAPGADMNPNRPNCKADVHLPDGTACASGLLPGTTGTCQGGQCVAPLCKYDVDCPDGYVCDANWHCSLAPAGTFGAACNSNSQCGGGLICCADMQGDGLGTESGLGQGTAGRCARCCGNAQNTADRCLADQDCCDGQCVNSGTDERFCGGCVGRSNTGAAVGEDCIEAENACYPSSQCIAGTCVFDGPCPAECSMAAYQAQGCTPTIFNNFCFTVPSACRNAPYTGCAKTCVDYPNIVDAQCNNAPCRDDGDCCGTHRCVATCGNQDYGQCVTSGTCQPR